MVRMLRAWCCAHKRYTLSPYVHHDQRDIATSYSCLWRRYYFGVRPQRKASTAGALDLAFLCPSLFHLHIISSESRIRWGSETCSIHTPSRMCAVASGAVEQRAQIITTGNLICQAFADDNGRKCNMGKRGGLAPSNWHTNFLSHSHTHSFGLAADNPAIPV